MASTLKDIPPLLHDARMSDCRWDRRLKTLHISIQCLRRNLDGTPVDDSTVDLKLDGVERIVAYYSPANVSVKPSEFKVDSRLTLADLECWPRGSVEAHLAINSLQSEFELTTSRVQETLFGETEHQHGESPLRVHVSFEPHNYGPQASFVSLSIDCDLLEPFTNGVPFDIETWRGQFEAWWKGWQGHWSEKNQSSREEAEPTLEDTFIPAGKPAPPDLSYRPPTAPPFQLSSTKAPAELLKPIADYHNGMHEQDWSKMAAAYPYFDQDHDERATRLRDQFLVHASGRWMYVRHIDGWWCEGNRACVVVRGIEHDKGDEESPSRNEETVVTYGLRKFRQTWVIATWSQGWPRFGSAAKLHDAQTWRDGWNLAE